MPLTPGPAPAPPGFWETFGHSYFMTTVGTLYQTGRIDALVRNDLEVDFLSWKNHCVTGSQLVIQGRSQGGFARVLQEVTKSQRTSPYAANGGGCILCWGINDIGNTGNSSQIQTAFRYALRTVISRWRCSSLKISTDASISYGAGFTTNINSQDWTSGTSFMAASSTTNANFTITLPSDYGGEVVTLSFVGAGGVAGGTASFSGTASFASSLSGIGGSAGTVSTSNILPGTALSHCPVTVRGQGTSADAGKTITVTVTQVDSGGQVGFDSWWLEASHNPPPVIVCNIPRILTSGYASYPTWTSSQAGADADVANFNSVIGTTAAEFDSMVQIADLDHALNKDLSNPAGVTTLFFTDGVHPNEFGAAKCADAILAAVRQLGPVAGLGPSACLQVDSPHAGAARRGRQSQQFYLPEFQVIDGTSYTAVQGHMFAIPVIISEARERWVQFQLEQVNSPATSGSSIRWGIYDDVGWTGYPQCLVTEPTSSSGALALGTTSGMKQSPSSGSGSLNQPLDPGLYWIALKIDALGTTASQIRACSGPSQLVPCGGWVAGTAGKDTGWRVTGLSAGALPGTFTAGGATTGTAAGSCPLVGFKVF